MTLQGVHFTNTGCAIQCSAMSPMLKLVKTGCDFWKLGVQNTPCTPGWLTPNRPVRNRRRPAWMNSGDYVLYSQHAATSGNKELIVKVCMSFLDSNNRMFETMMKVINSS